jgi:membrane-bound metal-dependent hydrolase YbcI (DUF457 family)
MPNRPTHLAVGTVSGLAAGILTSRSLPQKHQLLHVTFAGIGGSIGALAPDTLEPPISPNHRGVFHSVAAAGSIGAAQLAGWQADCHLAAAFCDTRALCASPGSHERSNQEVKAFLWRALAGLIVGFLTGYASHLILDATTVRSLPFLTENL